MGSAKFPLKSIEPHCDFIGFGARRDLGFLKCQRLLGWDLKERAVRFPRGGCTRITTLLIKRQYQELTATPLSG